MFSFNKLLAMILVFTFTVTVIAENIVVESCGEPISFNATPERVVVHDKNLTELLLALGLQDSIVGVTGITGWYAPSDALAEAIEDIPELNPKDPVLENILSVQPDFFFAGWYYGMQPSGPVTPELLRPFGISTYVLSESCVHVGQQRSPSLDLLFDDVVSLGKIFRVEESAEMLITGWEERIEDIESRVSGLQPVRVFMHYDGEATPFTSGGLGMVQAIIDTAGGENITSELPVNWGETSWEIVASRDPEVIIIFDDQTDERYQRQINVLRTNPLTRQLDAVINERFVIVQYREVAPGPGNIEAIEKLARALHPEAF